MWSENTSCRKYLELDNKRRLSENRSVISNCLWPHGPGASVHGILQARILEWVATSFYRGTSQPRDWIRVSWTAGRFFDLSLQGSATLKALMKTGRPTIRALLSNPVLLPGSNATEKNKREISSRIIFFKTIRQGHFLFLQKVWFHSPPNPLSQYQSLPCINHITSLYPS